MSVVLWEIVNAPCIHESTHPRLLLYTFFYSNVRDCEDDMHSCMQVMLALLSGPLWHDSMISRGTALSWFDAALSSRRSQPSDLLGTVSSTYSLAQVRMHDLHACPSLY